MQIIQAIFQYMATVQLVVYHQLFLVTIETIIKETIIPIQVAVSGTEVSMIAISGT